MVKRKGGRAWRRIRWTVLVRDGFVCQMDGPTCTRVATTVDHVDPLALGGSELPDPSRLRAACMPCNSRAGQVLSTRSHRLGSRSREYGSAGVIVVVLAALVLEAVAVVVLLLGVGRA